MSSNADKLIAAARSYVNMTERGPQRDNYGSAKGSAAYGYSSQGGHIVDDSNIEGGYGRSNTPWCGNFICVISKEAGYRSYQHTRNGSDCIGSGYTGTTYQRARDKGWIRKGRDGCVPGALGIRNGQHVFLVISKPDSSGRYESIGGNESDKCRHATRNLSEGWDFIVGPSLGTSSGGTKTMYFFEDLNKKPTLFGGWPKASTRDEQYAKREAYNQRENTGRLLRKVKHKGNFAFEEWPAGSWVNGGWATFAYGGWSTKEARDGQAEKYKAANPGASIRIYSEKRSAAGGSSPGESGEAKYT